MWGRLAKSISTNYRYLDERHGHVHGKHFPELALSSDITTSCMVPRYS
jgi:hypothetical protein